MQKEQLPNITYLLGAGASANAIPVVNSINEAIKEMGYLGAIMANQLKKQSSFRLTVGGYTIGIDVVDKFKDFILKWTTKIQNSNSIETYAKRLYDNDNTTEYNEYKAFLTILFHYFHFLDYERFCDEKNRYSKNPSWSYDVIGNDALNHSLENRYESFFRSISLKSDKQTSYFNTSIPDNFNFISWNYDFQFEFSRFGDIQNGYRASPTKNMEYFKHDLGKKLLKINGTSFIEKFTTPGYSDLLSPSNNYEIYELLLYIYIHFYNSGFETEIFRFSWEEGKENIVESLRKIAKITDILVVIGYSFPSFNREMDKEFYSNLKADCIIYTQGYDMNDSRRIENYFKQCFSPNGFRKYIYPVESPFFFIPPQFFDLIPRKEQPKNLGSMFH